MFRGRYEHSIDAKGRTSVPSRFREVMVAQGDSRLVDKSLYTIGQPGGNLAVISRRAHGYFLMHLGGDRITRRNGEEVHGAGVVLASGDQIQVGDIQLEFYTES